MTEFLGLPLPFLLLFSVSLAAGVDFFLTLLVLAIVQGLGWPGIQEAGPHPLQWAVFAGVAGLYLLEAAAELRPFPALLWHNLQLLLRPLGGILLAVALLDGYPSRFQLLGALTAAIVCAFTHVLSWGQKLLPFLNRGRNVSVATRILAEDTLVLAFLFVVLNRPELGSLLSGSLLLLGLLSGGSSHQVVRFGLFLLKGRAWDLMHRASWRDAPELPRWIRGPRDGEPEAVFRGIPAGVQGLPGLRGFREGWMVEGPGGRRFVFRRWRKAGSLPLDADSLGQEERFELAWRIPISSGEGRRAALFLQGNPLGSESHK